MAMPTASVAFLLPSGRFNASRELPESQQELYRTLARDRLNATLATERELRNNEHTRRTGAIPGVVTHVNPREWKSVRSKHDLRVLRRRANGRSPDVLAGREDHRDMALAVQNGQPSLLCIGRVEGALDDVLYGLHNPSQVEMQAVTRHVDVRVLDCASLATIDTAMGSDKRHPMHYLGLKWALSKLPGSLVVLPRDVCFLEALGVASDYDGRRVGYFIQHSVDDPACPPFDERATGIMRAHVYLTYLFRENSPGFVDVFARGVMDAPGLVPKFVSAVAASTLLGLFNVVRCAQAKKLTLLANRRAVGLAATVDETGRRPRCGVCSRKPSGLDLTRPRTCRVCRVPVCSKCRLDRTMFVRSSMPDRVSLKKVSCCITCVLEAKSLRDIHPCDPESSLFSMLARHQAKADHLGEATTASAKQPSSAVDDRATDSSSCSSSGNGSKGGQGTASSSESRSQRSDMRELTSRSITTAGFAESVMDDVDIGIGASDYEGSVVMSEIDFSEGESELEGDTTDDEAIDVDTFNRGTAVLAKEETELDMRNTVKVGEAYEAFTKRFTLEESAAPSSSPSMGSSDPADLLEKIMALHTSVQEAYSLTQANQELMTKAMRSK